MKKRLLSILVLLPLIALAGSAPASAQKPIPNINQTKPFKSLKRYVGFLQAKRDVPASSETKTTYRLNLSNRRTKANLKAKALYTRRITRISKQDDRKERRQIKLIRQAQRAKVSDLNTNLANRLAKLRAKETVAIARVNSRYSSKITSLTNKRNILRKRLDKTRNPVKRDKITVKINAVQKQINTLVNSRQADVNSVATRYDNKADNVNDLFAAKIRKAKESARSQVAQAKAAYKRIFRTQIAAAKTKRQAQIGLITDLAERGTNAIAQMPPVNE
jgi:hypothetical protein